MKDETRLNIVGIDASTKSTGISYFIGDRLTEYSLIRSQKKDGRERIIDIRCGVKEFLSTKHIDYIFIENVPLANSVNKLTAEHLLVLQGVIYGLAIDVGCKFVAMQPSNWRRLAKVKPEGRKRDNQKEAAIKLVNEMYGFEYEWVDGKTDEKTGHSDICESILIGVAGLTYIEELLKEAE